MDQIHITSCKNKYYYNFQTTSSAYQFTYTVGLNRGITMEIKNNTKNRTNNIFAIEVALAAIPPNPKTAATKAIIKKVTDQFNICTPRGIY